MAGAAVAGAVLGLDGRGDKGDEGGVCRSSLFSDERFVVFIQGRFRYGKVHVDAVDRPANKVVL